VSPAFEAFLARIYVEEAARERFIADPRGEAQRALLAPDEVAALAAVDPAGLRLAADSFARKRTARKRTRSWWARMLGR
jgi:hypothetical protein